MTDTPTCQHCWHFLRSAVAEREDHEKDLSQCCRCGAFKVEDIQLVPEPGHGHFGPKTLRRKVEG